MFIKQNLPKIYCKIKFCNKNELIKVDFYWLLALKTINSFLKIINENWYNKTEWWVSWYIDASNLDILYHFLANDNFIPISENFFYRDMEKKDQISS